MPRLESLKRDILAECEEDHVGLWSIIRDVERYFPKLGEAALRSRVMTTLHGFLLANEIQAGLPTRTGGFRLLRLSPEKLVEQVASQWPVGRRPTIGEGLWFTRAKKRGRYLGGHIARHVLIDSRKLNGRLQKETALASAPARRKKRLGK